MRSDKQEQELRFTRRALLMGGAGALVFSAVGARLYAVQILDEERYRGLSDSNQFRFPLVPPSRGRIVDRFGVPIADNRDSYRVLITPEQVDDVGVMLDQLSEFIEIGPNRRARILEDVARGRSFDPVMVADDLDWETFSAINLAAPRLGGVTPDVAEVRAYPYGEAFYHVVGYVRTPDSQDIENEPDNEDLLLHPGFQIGKEGVERAREETLRGAPGTLKVEVNNLRRVIRELPDESLPPTEGNEVVLSLDADIQRYATERLAGESAAVVVMDVRSGEVIALASVPGADPNLFVTGLSTQQMAEYQSEYRPLFDKALMGRFSPGSTFKSVVAAAALEDDLIPPSETVNCQGKIELGDREFNCWRRRGHGPVDMREAIKTSCDVYFYEVAQRLGIDRINEMARRMGLGDVYDLGIPGHQQGLVPTPQWMAARRQRRWSTGDTLNVGIGQGDLLATPLQLTVMTARIAGGRQITPTLFRQGISAPPAHIGLEDETLFRVRDALRAVCHEPGGTSFGLGGLGIEGVEMAGKTGSAQVFSISREEREAGVREQEDLPWRLRDNGFFCCYAPADDPKYAVTVVVEHGGGSSAATYPARDILRRVIERDPSGRPGVMGAAPSAVSSASQEA